MRWIKLLIVIHHNIMGIIKLITIWLLLDISAIGIQLFWVAPADLFNLIRNYLTRPDKLSWSLARFLEVLFLLPFTLPASIYALYKLIKKTYF